MSVHVPRLTITMCNPAGIGPEMIARACRRLQLCFVASGEAV
jgi:4-hydroxy-L-threonine phosphate dehydrogenase PdxA